MARHTPKPTVKCDALLVDTASHSDTYPYVDIREDEAAATIMRGFVESIARELPMEYAIELSRLIELQMEGAVG